MKFLWISGWAIPPTWLAEQASAAWPQGRHQVITPAAAETAVQSADSSAFVGKVERALRARSACAERPLHPSGSKRIHDFTDYDVLGGYSLGALWLLKNAAIIPANIPVILLAPMFAFPAEAGGGGRVALAQLRAQKRSLRRNAPAAVADFYLRAGLDAAGSLPAPGSLTPAQVAELDEGLEWLEKWRAPIQRPPENWRGFVGDKDALLDAPALCAIWPELQVVTGAGHAPGPLLRAAAAASISTGIS